MKILDYTPSIFHGEIFKKIYESHQAQIDILNNNIEDIRKQRYISSATWGLTLWEEFLKIKTELTDNIEDRRARCYAKIRGTGNCTIDYIKYVALSYQCGDIDPIENDDSSITIEFISLYGTPRKLEEFKKMMRTIIPCHLAINYKFKYHIYGDYAGKTWQDIKNIGTWDQCRINQNI